MQQLCQLQNKHPQALLLISGDLQHLLRRLGSFGGEQGSPQDLLHHFDGLSSV